MLTYHQKGPVMFIWGQFRLRCHSHQSIKWAWNYFFILLNLPGANELSCETINSLATYLDFTVTLNKLSHHVTGAALLSSMVLAVDQLNRTSCGNPNTWSICVPMKFFVLGSIKLDKINFIWGEPQWYPRHFIKCAYRCLSGKLWSCWTVGDTIVYHQGSDITS